MSRRRFNQRESGANPEQGPLLCESAGALSSQGALPSPRGLAPRRRSLCEPRRSARTDGHADPPSHLVIAFRPVTQSLHALLPQRIVNEGNAHDPHHLPQVPALRRRRRPRPRRPFGLLAKQRRSGIIRREAADAAKPVILVTSFGTSYNSTRHVTIGAIEDAIREKYGRDYDVRRAFTSQIIIDKLKERDGIEIDNVEEALDRAKADGVETVIVQPTHLMAGLEYTDIKDELDKRSDDFKQVALGEPLLASDADYQAVAEAIAEQRANLDDGACAFVLMGHGTTADSNADYATMQRTFDALGKKQFFVGTVEAEPTCEDVIAGVQAAGYAKAVLSPFMVVAGDHATNDMADTSDPDSWASKFTAAGIETTCLLEGLGQYSGIDDIYVDHVAAAIESL